MSRFEREVRKDYSDLLSNVSLRVSDKVKDLLLLQSVIGHAQNRHGKFSRAYPNATIDDIVLALGKDPVGVRSERQRIIDSIFEFVVGIINNKSYGGYVDNKGNTLISLGMNMPLRDPAATLKGVYLAGVMDNFEWRMRAKGRYNFDIGGGECVAVDLPKLRYSDITLEELAKEEWTEGWIEDLKKSKVIIDRNVEAKTNKNISAYVRYKKGQGTSDDLAIILAGKIYGNDAALGVFLGDAIDTWDKYAERLVPGGQDEYLSKLIYQHSDVIRSTYGEFELPSDKDVMKFIYTIALQKDPYAISNSQRYFLQVDEDADKSAIESHLDYVNNRPIKEIRLGHLRSNLTNTKLYKLFEKRFNRNYCCR